MGLVLGHTRKINNRSKFISSLTVIFFESNRSPNSFNYGPPNSGMPMNTGSPFVPAIPNSVPMPTINNGSPNTQPKNPPPQLGSPQLYNVCNVCSMTFKKCTKREIYLAGTRRIHAIQTTG